MNRGLAVSADSTRWPSLRATSPSGGNCSLRLTIADAAPAVERPSSHAQPSMTRRKSATSALLRTLGIQISMPARSEPRREHHRDAAARCLQYERRRALIQRIVIELVEDVVDEQLCGPVLVDLGLHEGIEAPIARQLRALVRREERAAVDLRAIDRLATELPDVGELVLGQQAERLVRDVGKRQTDV